jgi:muramoyltetrapeptide carboxypeptidase
MEKTAGAAMSKRVYENPFPPQVKRIGIPAPASMPKRDEIKRAVRLIESWGVEALVGRNVFAGGDAEYLSASDEARLDDLNGMIRDESVDLILCARGGYGCMRIVEGVDWAALKRRRLPLLGYSDITALHLAMLSKGAGIPVVCGMAHKLDKTLANPFAKDSMSRTLQGLATTGERQARVLTKLSGEPLDVLKDGSCEGPLLPVNLTLLCYLLGTPFMPSLKGSILAVEDIGEKPRTVDRSLAQLALAGVLGEISGLVFGYFTDCGEESGLRKVRERYAALANGPVLSGLPFGHETASLSFVMGAKARIDGAGLSLR